ncbi:coordinator of PRMT5 and differentiation stimulator isoform 2 [Mus musculus]|uniref:coordinator of PRMT5 and differentiation stimulator isoform 2 n=1 Tax=Mus musculus TaxID=10090 RepID=UPI0003D6F2D8|nr:coordinator of PRMT5 and differentiation stimulator isoform 2 [Mus musculus]|eukprot:XP_006508911.1 PREDICTED: coordinator of PRMT5 and differentiation stimulator isoform X2 [Mus musculus]
MDPQAATGRGPGERSSQEAPSAEAGFATADLSGRETETELAVDRLDADDIQGSISQEIKPWVCCAPQGDMIYDPSWHHPPPLIPHYSKMVFETGQFDDAED